MAMAVAQAKAQSPYRVSALRVVEGSTLAARLAGKALNPLIELRSENWGADRQRLPLDVFAVATQTIELGGKRPARMAVAQAQRGLSMAQLTIIDQQLAVRTTQLYVQALRAQGALAAYQSNREGLTTLITSVGRRVEEGYSPEADLLRFRTEAARVDIEISKARIELDRALMDLTALIGHTQPIEATQLVEPPALAMRIPTPTEIAGAVSQHPEALAADARINTARQAGRLERARAVPDPMVTAGYKRTGGFDTAVLGVTMAVPLFDRNASAVARTAGEERAAAAERDAVVTRLIAEVTSRVNAARTLGARSTEATRELLAPADTVRSAARAMFREGATDVLRLIDAERVHADVQRTALELRLDALAATLEARLLLGEELFP